MQLADEADVLARQLDARTAPGVHGWVLGAHEAGFSRREQGFDVALHVEEVDRTLRGAPLGCIDAAKREPANAHRLQNPPHADRSIGGASIAHEHAAGFEHAHAGGLARQVVAQHVDEAAEQAGAHHRQVAGQRVEQANRLCVAGKLTLPALLDKTEVHRLLVVERGKLVAQRVERAVGLAAHMRHQRGLWRGVGQKVVAEHADHFFDQVFFDLQVEAPARRRDRQQPGGACELQAQALHHAFALCLRQRHADHLRGARHTQRHGLAHRQARRLVVHRAGLAAADVDDQRRQAFDGRNRHRRVNAALEAVAGIGREVEAPRAARHRFGPPERSFHVHALRLI